VPDTYRHPNFVGPNLTWVSKALNFQRHDRVSEMGLRYKKELLPVKKHESIW
jgi:hypothetical protein